MGSSRACPQCGATIAAVGTWCANCMGSNWTCQKCGYTRNPPKAARCYNCGQLKQTPLRQALERVVAPGFRVPPTTPATYGVITRAGLQIGEVSRHFDSGTAGQITGSIAHEFGFHGGAVGITVRGVGLGVGSLGLSGQSSANLQTESTTRPDLLNDGFLAVFDEPSPLGIPDTLRVVVPSEAACREMLQELMAAAGAAVVGGLTALQLSHLTAVATSVSTEIGYVADRLSAVIRVSPSPSPVFSVVGLEVGSHTLLGGAIQMPGEERWMQLFPFGLLRAITPGGDLPQLPAGR